MKKPARKPTTIQDQLFQLEPLINSLVWGISVLELIGNEDPYDADKMAWCLRQVKNDGRALQEEFQAITRGHKC